MNQRLGTVRWTGFATTLAVLFALSGCGKSEGGPEEQAAKSDNAKSADPVVKSADGSPTKTGLPIAAVNTNTKKPEPPKPPKKGTPQWYIHEILMIRFQKFEAGADAAKLRKLRKERNDKIVKLAEECIAKTHKDKDQQQVFNAAVHQLLEARVALALQGTQKEINALYDVADALYKRDPKSKAAADAAYRVAAFANVNAIRFPDPKNGWLKEFVRRARLFANDFKHDKTRAAQLLSIAGQSCEAHRQTADAISCYTQLQANFADMPQAKRAVAILRRLKLPGKPLQLAGPTIDGGFLDVKDAKGKVLLVVFWASDNKPSRDLNAMLLPISKKYKKAGLRIVGVNLDREEPVVDTYLEKSKIDWPQVFYPDRTKRRWENLIAKYYGIRALPTIWLVDQAGIVRDTQVNASTLDKRLESIFARSARRSN